MKYLWPKITSHPSTKEVGQEIENRVTFAKHAAVQAVDRTYRLR